MMKRRMTPCGVVLCGVVLAAAAIRAQQQPPTAPATQNPAPPVFRSQVNYVEIDVTVTDSKGRVVTDLTADDFDVREGGEIQKVADFSFVDIPIEAEARLVVRGRPVEADVRSNQHAEGRLYLIVMDDVHIAPARTMAAKAAARQFIEKHLGPNDLASVLFTGSRAQDSQDFTNNRQLLVAAIDRLIGRKEELAQEALETEPPDDGGGDTGDADVDPGDALNDAAGVGSPNNPLKTVNNNRARAVMKTLVELTDFLKTVRGRRKALLFVSEGVNANLTDPLEQSSSVIVDTRDATSAATRSNIAIYPIDPRGLDSGFDIGDTQMGGSQTLRAEQGNLRTLANDTGGFAITSTNNFGGGFDRIVAETSSYYLLGYYSSAPRDGQFRRVDVRLKREGMRVRVRGRLDSPDGRPSSSSRPAPAGPAAAPAPNAVVEASRSAVPLNDVGLKVYMGAYKGQNTKTASVAVVTEVDVTKFDFAQADGRFVNRQLLLRYVTTDAAGTIRPPVERFTIDLNMRPETFGRAQARGVRVVSQLSLPPGRYQLRVAGGHADSEAGSIVADIEVPDFSKPKLSMSGLMIASAHDSDVLTIRPDDPQGVRWWSSKRFIETPPTTLREFAATDTLVVRTEFYEKEKKSRQQTFAMRVQLLTTDGKVVKEVTEERAIVKDRPDFDRYEFAPALPLAGVAPGRYVLHVEGRSATSGNVSRDVPIRVRP